MGDYIAYENCRLCPRNCGVNRLTGSLGFCGQGSSMKIASVVMHKGEEPPISGLNGSGTIFFTGCTMRCDFCQNFQISREDTGRIVSDDEFYDILFKLQISGAQNINIVTGTHFIPSIITVLRRAKNAGLILPVIWNTSCYEKITSLEIINDYIDIYLPDIKSLDRNFCSEHFHAADYPDYAVSAVEYMVDHKPLYITKDDVKTGVIVRHLTIPGRLDMTYRFLDWYKDRIGDKALLSMMTQYIPNGSSKITNVTSEIDAEQIFEYMDNLSIDEGFFQELNFDDDWMPDFNKENPFPEKFSTTVWHFSN